MIELKNDLNHFNQELKKEESNENQHLVTGDDLKRKISGINKEINAVDQKIKYLCEDYQTIVTSEPVYTNGDVDIYKHTKYSVPIGVEGIYLISLHSDKTIIGTVNFRSDAYYKDNISYEIEEDYRRQGYGFQAMSGIFKYLGSNNVETVTIHTSKDNIASQKLADKLMNIFPCKMENLSKSFAYHYNISRILVNANEGIK